MNTALNYQPEVLVDTADLSREDWLDYRRLGIGGSDAAAIMGLSPFATIRDLYFDKIGVTPVIEEEEENWVAKEVGHRLEDLVAMIFAKKTGLEVFPVRKMFRHPLYPFMLADVDYFIRFPDGSIGILECKTCNYNAKDKWADDGIPENYVLQVRHYLAVMNMNKAYIACLYGNNENEFIYRCLERDRMEEEELIDQEKYFWEEYVEKKIEPPYSGKPDLILASIRKYNGYADKSIPEISISSLESRSLEKYLKLSEEKSQLEKRKKEIEAEQRALSVPFVELLGQGCKAVIEDGSFRYQITYNPMHLALYGKLDASGETFADEGKTTLVMMPALGVPSPHIYFKPLAQSLDKSFNIVIVEPFGYGLSDGASTNRTVDNINSELNAALDTMGIKQCVLLVHSISGVYGLNFVQNYPEKVKGFIAVDNTVYDEELAEAMEVEKKYMLQGIDEFQKIKNSFSSLEEFQTVLKADPEKYGAALPQVSGYTYTETDREEYIQAYSLSSNDTVRNEVNGMDQSLLSIKNKKFPSALPVLTMISSENVQNVPAWETAHRNQLDLESGNHQLYIVNGGHYIWYTNLTKVVQLIDEWRLENHF